MRVDYIKGSECGVRDPADGAMVRYSMWARVRLDIGWMDLASGIRNCLVTPDRAVLERELEALWSDHGDALVSFSVRSGFDLLLEALDFPEETEILFTALNIKGMLKIARRHGLLPIPVDLDPETMAPDLASLEHAISPATRAIVVAPLFGARGDRGPLIEIAKRHGLIVIEDAAQAFAGLGYSGHPDADVSLFSFGPLKHATALGGALLRVREPELLERMRTIQDGYPIQETRDYAVRLLKYAGLRLMTTRVVLATVVRLFRLRGQDYEDAVAEPVRGVAKLGSAKKIRRRCSAPLLAMLVRRLTRWQLDPARRRAAEVLRDELEGWVELPSIGERIHSFWAFPILVDDPQRVMSALREQGFDAATLRRSAAVEAPLDRPMLDPTRAKESLSRLVVIPCYPTMPKRELRREAEVIRGVVRGLGSNA